MENLSPTVQLACDLIRRPSVTPSDEGCQKIMIERLRAIGFDIVKLDFDDVENFWAVRGSNGPTLCFAGHTDVVPVGDSKKWNHPPFEPALENGLLYGRGAADMKGSLAAMITASENFVKNRPDHNGKIAFLITSDEEGPALNGTVKVVDHLQQNRIPVEYCIVGEPSSSDTLGDIIKNGRRGSINGYLTIKGVQGHVAYPQKARNPVQEALKALNELSCETWDKGNAFFPATSFQISNIHAGTGATNVIPGEMEVIFNLRFSSELTAETIKQRTSQILDKHGLTYTLEWVLSGNPFVTAPGELVTAAESAIRHVTGVSTTLSTSGGTSDGRFIATLGSQIIELGPLNATIHQIDECVSTEDLDKLSRIYENILYTLLNE
ncbi:MAG: succinyl-diaminopimelate desuccinylase [Pseudomonadales bacterium]|nr:succinyl-diaminopimelate desuccinylase [Pseudomonadales bacterium]